MPHAFCHVDLLKDLGAPGSRKRRRQAAHVLPEDAALHAANARLLILSAFANPGSIQASAHCPCCCCRIEAAGRQRTADMAGAEAGKLTPAAWAVPRCD